MDRTSDFGSDSEGSNPSATTIKIYRTLFSVSYFFAIFVKVIDFQEKNNKKMKEINKIKENKLLTIKEIANNYNVTNYEISKNTGVSEGTLSRLMRGVVTNPRKNVIDAIYNYLTTHYPHNEATHNINSNGNNNTPPQQDSQVQTQENNIYTEMIATQRELIDTLKEQNSQYRKEIENLRQKIKGYVEKSKKVKK